MFTLGVITGIALSILVFVILAFFRLKIEQKIEIVGKQLGRAGPRPEGAIFEAPDEGDEVREEYLAKAKAEGRDVPLSDLM